MTHRGSATPLARVVFQQPVKAIYLFFCHFNEARGIAGFSHRSLRWSDLFKKTPLFTKIQPRFLSFGKYFFLFFI